MPPALRILAALCLLGAGLAMSGFVPPPLAGLLVGIGLGLVIVMGSTDPGSQLFGPAFVRGSADSPRVALTFDDGPHPESTPALLDILRRSGARATFFLLVDRAEARPDLTAAIAAEHEIGLHGLSHHPWLTLRSPARGATELQEARSRLEALGVHPIRWFRPPFGATSPRLAAAVARAGLHLVWCSLRTFDGGRVDSSAIRARCARATSGDIVLLHEGRATTTEALPGILADLAKRGLRPVTVGELLAAR